MNFFKKCIFVVLQIAFTPHALHCSYTYPDATVQSDVVSKIIGAGTTYKAIILNENVTINDSHNFTLGTTDSFDVQAQRTDKVEIDAAGSITGITPVGTIDAAGTAAKKAPTLTLKDTNSGNVAITGNVIVNGNLTIGTGTGGALIIDGDLTVKGAVTIAANATLTVKGDITFDGDVANAVSLAGTVSAQGVKHADGSKVKDGNIIIRNATSSSTEAVLISAAMTATGSIIIEKNSNTGGTTKNGVTISAALTATHGSILLVSNSSTTADGVNIASSLTARSDIVMSNNSSSVAGSDGVHITSAGSVTSSANSIHVIGNSSSSGSAGTGKGLYIEGSLSSLKDVTFKDNAASNTTAGADAVHIAATGSVTATGNVLIKDNTSASGDELGMASGGVLRSEMIVFNQNVTVSDDITNAGKIYGKVVIKGNLTVDTSWTNIIGSIIVLGGVVSITSAAALTVTEDVIFDGQSDGATTNNRVSINNGNITARNVIIQNYRNTTASTPACNILSTSSTITTTTGDIVIQNNTSSSGDGLYNQAILTSGRHIIIYSNSSTGGVGDDMGAYMHSGSCIAKYGDIIAQNNSSTTSHGFYFRSTLTTVEAKNIIVTDNVCTATCTGPPVNFVGALLGKPLICHDKFIVARNKAKTGEGCVGIRFLGALTYTAREIQFIYNSANTWTHLDDTTETTTYVDYYGGAGITPHRKTDASF